MREARKQYDSSVKRLGPKDQWNPDHYAGQVAKITEILEADLAACGAGDVAKWRALGDEAGASITPSVFAASVLLKDAQKTVNAIEVVKLLGPDRTAAMQLHATTRDPLIVAACIVAGEQLPPDERRSVTTLAEDHYRTDLMVARAAALRLSTAEARIKDAAGFAEVHEKFVVATTDERISRLGTPGEDAAPGAVAVTAEAS